MLVVKGMMNIWAKRIEDGTTATSHAPFEIFRWLPTYSRIEISCRFQFANSNKPKQITNNNKYLSHEI
jgi:hypothetical protein